MSGKRGKDFPKSITIKCTIEEWRAIQLAAAKAKTPFNTYVRKIVFPNGENVDAKANPNPLEIQCGRKSEINGIEFEERKGTEKLRIAGRA